MVHHGGKAASRLVLRLGNGQWLVCLALLAGCQWRTGRDTTHQEAGKLVDQAQSAASEGNIEHAQQLLLAALAADPEDSETRLQLSELLQEQGSVPAALEHLQQAIEQNPDDPRAQVLLAQIYFEQNQDEAARKHADLALRQDPHLLQALLLQGQLADRRGDSNLALHYFFEAISFDPHDPHTQFLTARQLYRTGAGDQAAPLLRRLTENAPACGEDAGEAWWLLGRCYRQQQRWKEAAEAMASGIELRAANSADWRELAEVQFRAGDLTAARSSLQMAARLGPGDPDIEALRQKLEAATANPIRLTRGANSPTGEPLETR
jgi:tetratricopeptide (TPR) repeat protein